MKRCILNLGSMLGVRAPVKRAGSIEEVTMSVYSILYSRSSFVPRF